MVLSSGRQPSVSRSNLRFGRPRLGISPKGLGGGPMRGIHPHPFSKGVHGDMLDPVRERNESLSGMVLP